MKESEYVEGTYLYKLGKGSDKEAQRVFIHTGYETGDGYGVLIGFTSDGKLCKSTGHGNYQYGGKVRFATQEEINAFLEEVIRYQDPIKAY